MSHFQQTKNFSTQENSEGTPQQQALHRLDKAEEVINAFSEGKLPTTDQLTTAIDKLEDQNILHDASRDMTPLGKKVVADTERLLDTTKNMLNEKNFDNQLQKVIFHSQRASNQVQASGQIGATKDVLTSEGQKSAQLLRDASVKASNVARWIATSSEFRNLLDEMNQIFQEIIYTKLPSRLTQTKDVLEMAQEGANMALDQAKEITDPKVEAFNEGHIDGKEAAKQAKDEATSKIQENLADLKLSPEQREHIIVQFQKLMREIQGSPEYRQALEDLIDILSELSQKVSSTAEQTQGIISAETTDSSTMAVDTKTAGGAIGDMNIAINNAKELVENFANGQSLDPLIATIKEFSLRLQSDKELHKSLSEIKNFIHQSLTDSKFLTESQYIENGSALIERVRTLLVNSYQDLTYRFIDGIKSFNYGLQQDQTSSAFAKDLETLTNDLFMDEKGQPTLKYDLVKDLSKVVPLLAKKLEYLPVPRIEESDADMDYILDNIVIKCSNILPKHVKIETKTKIDTYGNSINNIIKFKVKNIQAEAKDIAFYYKQKTGIAKLTDVGLVDLIIPGDGLSINMTITPSTTDEHTFRPLRVETDIDELKLNIHDSQHQMLYSLLSPFINSRVKKQMERVITEKLYQYIYLLDENITQASLKLKSSTGVGSENNLLNEQSLASKPIPEWGSGKFDVDKHSL